MLGQGTAFFPNYSTAKIAAVRMLRIIDRKPQIYSSQATGSSAWVSYILRSHYIRDYRDIPLMFIDLPQLQ
jgi:hypothetical protein